MSENKPNKQKVKRVGLYSMGLVLILSGLLILGSQIFKFDVWKIAIKVWPLILIGLGIEVLWFNYKNDKNEDLQIKISGFSILIIIFIVGINLALYSITEIGLLEKLEDEINTQEYIVENTGNYKVSKDIDTLVINGYKSHNLDIKIKDVEEINYIEDLGVRAKSEEMAEEKNESIISFEEVGNVIYIDKKTSKNKNYLNKLTLEIPSNMNIELEESADYIAMTIDEIKGNILVKDVEKLNLRLNSKLNLEVVTEFLEGDAIIDEEKWKVDKNDDDSDYIKRSIKIGDGKYKFKIVDVNNIKVNKI